MTESVLSDGSVRVPVSRRRHLLVVDDDPVVHELVANLLKADGWETSDVLTGEDAVTGLEKKSFDLVLLDLKLPGIDGFEVLRRAREFCSLPIVALSGLGSFEHRERFIELGGDDYITKPFLPDELRFRVQTALRKATEKLTTDVLQEQLRPKSDFFDGYLAVYLEAWRVAVKGKETQLTPKEHCLLRELVTHAGRVLDHEYLLRTVWGAEYVSDVNLLHTCVARLRAKIEPDHTHPCYIITADRIGYCFRNPA